jgi:hypothetical protein
MALRIALPARGLDLVTLTPEHALAAAVPRGVMIERGSGECSACFEPACVHRAVVVGEIEIVVAEQAVEHDQVVRLVTRENTRKPEAQRCSRRRRKHLRCEEE